MSYVGGPGYELYVPVEMARHVWLALHEASDGLGLDGGRLVDAGYYALDALRIEAGRRAWGAELGADETPFEAGATFAVKLAKRDGFIGREALVARQAKPLAKRLVTIVLDDADALSLGRRDAARRRRAGGRGDVGRLERGRRKMRRPRLPARRGGRTRARRQPGDGRPVGRADAGVGLGPLGRTAALMQRSAARRRLKYFLTTALVDNRVHNLRATARQPPTARRARRLPHFMAPPADPPSTPKDVLV